MMRKNKRFVDYENLSEMERSYLGSWTQDNGESVRSVIITEITVDGYLYGSGKEYHIDELSNMYSRPGNQKASNPYTSNNLGLKSIVKTLDGSDNNSDKITEPKQIETCLVEQQFDIPKGEDVATNPIETLIVSAIEIERTSCNNKTSIPINIVLDFDLDKIIKIGKSLGISESDISEIISKQIKINNYDILNTVLEKIKNI